MNTWCQMWGKTYQCQISNAGEWFIGVRFSKFHDFWWFFKVPWLSMTFPEFFFPGFPDPVGTLIYHPWELCGIHLRAISQEVLVSLMHKMCFRRLHFYFNSLKHPELFARDTFILDLAWPKCYCERNYTISHKKQPRPLADAPVNFQQHRLHSQYHVCWCSSWQI